jgi:hypothetical protein
MHQYAGIEPDNIPALVHKSAPPQVLDIAFELDAERPVIPGIRQTAVNIRPWKDEPPALAERGDFIHGDDARLLDGAHLFAFSGSGSRAAPGDMFSSRSETAMPSERRSQGVRVSGCQSEPRPDSSYQAWGDETPRWRSE